MSADLMRKLLVDTDRLVDRANRSYELDLRFRINGMSQFEWTIYDHKPRFWLIEDALDPELLPFSRPFDAEREQFLARRVMCFEGRWMSVRDLIGELATVDAGDAKGRRRVALARAERLYSGDRLPGVIRQVKTIGRIVVRSLRPLHDAVIAARTTTWASVSPDGMVELRPE